ncbi:hypothetical protein AN189_07935 [Loktanella sp. 3ANDIMAR09]|uniref:energy transducer TonB n=1 Tax=Loktanella sp. 3ANDIMAR09 TaxID=1225657 RepID=UPI0006F74489|nr:energy transducer TonB [Loktanella sp. 3ANDIMAR09]KQI68799.1 hypothetical protein AN189_07935 [Loktanella sp. 3ANDIMAR09]
MIRRATSVKLAALTAALLLHAGLAVTVSTRPTVQTTGGTGAAEVSLGNAFADMTAGTLHSTRPVAAAPVTPVAPAARPATSQAQPTAAMPASPSAPLQPSPTTARVTAQATDSAAVARTPRPPQRSAAFEETHSARPQPAPAAAPQGNAANSTQAGAATGTRSATARQSGTEGTAPAAGNAAASNYPGQVMRRLSRAGRPRVNARGTAVVAFSVGAQGQVATVALARSSGSAALDEAAVRLVQNVGSFPIPPAGAQRSFSVQIQGR